MKDGDIRTLRGHQFKLVAVPTIETGDELGSAGCAGCALYNGLKPGAVVTFSCNGHDAPCFDPETRTYFHYISL